MITALKLCANHDGFAVSSDPKFRVRGQVVTLEDVLAYFKRNKKYKDIDNILSWVADKPSNTIQMMPNVELILPSMEEDLEQHDNSETPSSSTVANSSHSQSQGSEATSSIRPSASETQLALAPLYSRAQSNRISPQISPPPDLRTIEKIIQLSGSYCADYLQSWWALNHKEPTYHKHTAHGTFGHNMQDAIFHTIHTGSPQQGFLSAFGMIEDMLRESHPMCIAQIFAIICELLAAQQGTSSKKATFCQEYLIYYWGSWLRLPECI